VKKGHVEFPDTKGLVAKDRDLVTWTPDSIPHKVLPVPPELEKEYGFYAARIGNGPPVWRIVGASLVAGGLIAWWILRDDGRRKGRVTIGLPL